MSLVDVLAGLTISVALDNVLWRELEAVLKEVTGAGIWEDMCSNTRFYHVL
jgi:hypothetical protein